MNVKSRRIRKPISVVLMLALMLSALCFGNNPLSVQVSASSSFQNNVWYYIKNVKSGKYLTVQGNNASPGANLVQWTYTGDPNQKWKFTKITSGTHNGQYLITSALHNENSSYDLVVVIPNGSNSTGVLAKLQFKDLSAYQYYNITNLSNSSHRFMTFASDFDYALVANGASVYSNTSIVQGQTGVQWSDQWLFEPCTKDSSYGVWYANDNQEHRLATYMDFDFYGAEEVPVSEQPALRDAYESTNFVSQCLNICGKHYNNTGSSLKYWYSYKDEHIQNQMLTNIQFYNYWTITQNWYKPLTFYNYYTNSIVSGSGCGYVYDTFNIENSGYCNYNGSISHEHNPVQVNYTKGDIIMIISQKSNTMNNWKFLFTGYIKQATNSNRGNYVIASHTHQNKFTNWSISELCDYFQSYKEADRIVFIKSSTYYNY